MKIEILKFKKKWRKGGFHTNPNIGWGLVLLVALGLILGSLFFGVVLFRQIQAEHTPEESGTGGQIRIVKKARIEKVLEYFRERQERSEEILITPSPVVDPSR